MSDLDAKENWREVFRSRRSRVFPKRRRAASRRIVNRLLETQEFRRAETVLLYAPVRKEIDVLGLMGADESRQFLFPRVDGRELVLHRVDRPELELERGKFGIKAPVSGRTPVVEPERVDLSVIPGLVYDHGGYRIGYGGGFYDRLLSRSGNCRSFGVAYTFQVVDYLPRADHDVAMDRVVTPRATYGD